MQMLSSGRTAVNINEEAGPYFPTHCGVRQGDPFSPFLLNMVVDALATILDKAKAADHIHGVVTHLMGGGGVSLLQYANDTIIMVEGAEDDIINLKFLLLYFQRMSGLKINFDKSEEQVPSGPAHQALRLSGWTSLGTSTFFQRSAGSQFWQWVIQLLPLLCIGSSISIGSGSDTLFWYDRWVGDSPFVVRFPDLFSITVEPRTSVEVALLDLGRLAFRCPFDPPEIAPWDEMLECIAFHSPNVDIATDRMSWHLEPSGRFSSRSLYQAIAPSTACRPSLPCGTLGYH
ncbi:putative TdLSC37 protein [Hordeum vulgare]|nr:putative TdLSC37 protein [Hordeum vulgare]